MIKCNATGRHCHVMTVVLYNPAKNRMGVLLTEDKVIVYRIKLLGENIDYVMPYCPWCGARLRGAGSVVKRAT
jgi:tRNA(Ile2) C34 agmatinyltransferase TiaS